MTAPKTIERLPIVFSLFEGAKYETNFFLGNFFHIVGRNTVQNELIFEVVYIVTVDIL